MNFDQLPTEVPHTPVLDRVDVTPEAISSLTSDELVQLANELREFFIPCLPPVATLVQA
jgi:hypothetical protein